MLDEKICLICQPCGLGDILYMQKIARIYYDMGYKIIWPIIYEFEFLSEYIDWINWVSWKDINNKLTGPPFPDDIIFPYKEYYSYHNDYVFTNDFVYINGFYPVPDGELIMQYKYKKCNIDSNDWSDYLNFKRNIKKENELYNLIGLSENEEYVLVNRLYQTRPNVSFYDRISNDPLFYNKPVVEWTIVDDYSPFDWCKVIENASSIVTIDTSIQYIIENLKNKKASDYICYLRSGQYTYNQINFFSKSKKNL